MVHLWLEPAKGPNFPILSVLSKDTESVQLAGRSSLHRSLQFQFFYSCISLATFKNLQTDLNTSMEVQKYKQGGIGTLLIHSEYFCLQSIALELTEVLNVSRYF